MARKIDVKRILELRSTGMSQNAIAVSRHTSKHSIGEVFHIADANGIGFDAVADKTPGEVYQMFFPDRHAEETMYEPPDYAWVHTELKRVGVTLKLLWEEYKGKCTEQDKIPVGYTKFCEGYRMYTIAENLTNHLEHKPGQVTEVDWSGPTMSYIDSSTGEVINVYLFVATLPYSQYSYVEPTLDMKMETFIRCHVHMFEYFEGVTTRVVCDNLKAGVVSHPKNGEIVLTNDYEALGVHYKVAIMPTGVRKPKQKASVEGTVGKVATAVIAKLRNEQFYSFPDIKSAVSKCLYAFNHGSFQKREGTRYDAWLEEKPFLHPLPAMPYEVSTWVYGRKVGFDFHVIFEKNRYSCPYQYAGKTVDLRVTDTLVEIYQGDQRISTHSRFPKGRTNQYSTHPEDMPEKFKVTPWDDVRMKKWASSIGKYTALVVDRVFEGVAVKEQAYNPVLAILKLSSKYTEERLEAACEYAITSGIQKPRYYHLNAILSANQDIQYMEKKHPTGAGESSMGYLRGADYYGGNGNA